MRSLEILAGLDDAIGRLWFKHARAAGAADDLLRVVTADGMFTTKIDGWIHAANATTRSIARFVENGETPQLDLAEFTAWSGGNAALRYGRWQTDFHWKIDTRLWQYVLYLKFMRDAYRDAIDDSGELTPEEKGTLQRSVAEFFDQAELAFVYRWEVIERARGFAPHPDPTAGAATHGYTYEVIRPLPQPAFAELALDLPLGTEADGKAGERREVPAFPRLTDAVAPGVPEIARDWIRLAQACGVADRWLCVRLGDRMVPTRFNGWESAVDLVQPPLAAHAQGRTVSPEEIAPLPAPLQECDLRDYAVRFGICQAEFQRRLRGGSRELLDLLEALRRALSARNLAATMRDDLRGIDQGKIDRFFEIAARTIRLVSSAAVAIGEDLLPELSSRPVHPRFAPYDPVEPLPWEPRSPELYVQRMERLGYVM